MMLPIRYTLALALSLFSLLAYAQTPASQPNSTEPAVVLSNSATPNPASTAQTTQQPSELEQLQAAGSQLQAALNTLQQQSDQLQASLSTLNQQIEQSQLKKEQAQTPENAEQLQLLRTEYQQAQDTLIALRQQETLLQAHVAKLSQQLTQLPHSLVNAPAAASPTNGPSATTNTQHNPVNTTPEQTVATPLPVLQQLPQSAKGMEPAASSATTTPTNGAPVITTQNSKPKSAAKQDTSAGQDIEDAILPIKTTALSWMQDPAIMLRAGGGFVALALLLLILLFWPRSARKKANSPSSNSTQARNTPPLYPNQPFVAEENADLAPEYDFMGTEAAIPTRLDLARGYIEMGKLVEARAAIKPVLMKGDEAQKQEARCLLEKIELADTHI